ncbi:hypothetical protein [Alicyclobacillus macrosporangiidus]|uniref:hypothetical protein n=1 Tax=Alicyclobacillus macrosporangiidus TaxID=392015 RepID=UPI000689EE5B|nr:hypothetical protein [Alicyclobacillus macrosporangiidus]MCL6597904.1 hypothetical protein [Alicyclobacillus macrosporangiidus]
MNYGWPDWMFAAFAIGGWELFDLIARRFAWPRARWLGAAVVAVCLIILAVRYGLRWWRRRKHPPVEDPDEWKRY